MSNFTVILFALVSLAVITCKATSWIGTYNYNPAKNNPHWGNFKSNNGHWESAQKTLSRFDYSAKVADVSKNNNNYYIQLLVFVDYGLYSVYNKDEVQVRKYVYTFWKGVALRFKALKSLKISISIVGVIIEKTPFSTPYLQNNVVDRTAVDVVQALPDFGKYLYKARNLPLYDIAVQMTKLDLCGRPNGNGRCDRGSIGFAYVGGACNVNDYHKKVNSVAIIEDSGGYSGLIDAAHELGHLLGATHDGEKLPSNMDGPGGEDCKLEDGYIMSRIRNTKKLFQWSSCAETSIRNYLKTEKAECLLDGPHENSFEGVPLPGKMMSLDDQCFRDRGTKYFSDEPIELACTKLYCFEENKSDSRGVTYRPAAEGSPCGAGSHCINGECVSQSSNGPSNNGQYNFKNKNTFINLHHRR